MDKEQEKQVRVLTQAIGFLRRELTESNLNEQEKKAQEETIKEMVELRAYILKEEK